MRRATTHRLAQPHLVCEDAVEAVGPEGDEPLDALELVVAEGAAEARTHLLSPTGKGERVREGWAGNPQLCQERLGVRSIHCVRNPWQPCTQGQRVQG